MKGVKGKQSLKRKQNHAKIQDVQAMTKIHTKQHEDLQKGNMASHKSIQLVNSFENLL